MFIMSTFCVMRTFFAQWAIYEKTVEVQFEFRVN
jgi:hypothetical protein